MNESVKKNIVVITNLYPNEFEPNRGIFIRQLVEELGRNFNITVLCPVPWRPKLLSIIRKSPEIKKEDEINGVKVIYPRHIVIPKILRFTYGWLMGKALMPVLKEIHENIKIDLISAHWVYPDGFGAVMVAKKLNIPVSVHALGCDINEYTKYRLRKKLITNTLLDCDGVVVKSQDLAIKINNLGVGNNKIYTVLNGVDQNKFFFSNTESARNKIGLKLNFEYLLFIGNIQEEKGLSYLLKAISLINDFNGELLIIGSGPLEPEMKLLAIDLGINSKIKFIGSVPHSEISTYLNAVNALCLPSLREGCPNIVLESLSCGTPVIASKVGAVPQMMTDKAHGIMVTPKSEIELASAISEILNISESLGSDFKWYSWQGNAEKISRIFENLIDSHNEKLRN